jgi:hypothetical protein
VAVRSSSQQIDPQQEPGKGKVSGSLAPSVKRKRETEDVAKSRIFEKAAAPAPGPADIEEHLASTRPQIVSEERSGRNVEDVPGPRGDLLHQRDPVLLHPVQRQRCRLQADEEALAANGARCGCSELH